MHYSIVPFLEVKEIDFRSDAEYWHPDLVRNSNLISGTQKIGDFVVSRILNIKSTPIKRDFRYLEISSIAINSCEYKTTLIEQGNEPDRAHYILQKGDVVISTVRPNRNAVALVRDDGLVGSSGLSVLRTNGLEPEYLFAFCKTNYFIKCLTRANKATMYPAVSNRDVLDTPILVSSERFRALVTSLVSDSLQQLEKAVQLYTEADLILLEELQLDGWQPNRQVATIRTFSSLWQAGRIDAEYFRSQYNEIINAIKDYPGGWDTLSNLASMQKCVEVGSEEYLDEGIPFVRVSNLNPFEITEEKYISEKLYADIKQHQPEQGEILLSKDATPGIAHYLREPPARMIPSSGILRLQRKDDRVNDEYLTLVLSSMLAKEQANRDVGGSVILHWRPDQVAATLIPILPEAKQTEIEQKIAESSALRQQSKRLLESAKHAVEIAIEQDEPTAIAWLETEQAGINE